MIYLDNAATTKPNNEVLEAISPYLSADFGNPGSLHMLGRRAKIAIEDSREKVAAIINARPEQIIFTSSGTEANNIAVYSGWCYSKQTNRSIAVTTHIEHKSVLSALRRYFSSIKYIDGNGRSDLRMLEKYWNSVGFVSVMHTNNEIGIVNDLNALSVECGEDNGILFHTDCVQAVGYADIDVKRINCDFLSMSSHKIHGVKGVGALFAKKPENVAPLIVGGDDQEFGKRAGTENIAGIVGFGVACEIAKRDLYKNIKIINDLRSRFVKELLGECRNYEWLTDSIHFNGNCGKIVNFRIDGIDAETLLMMLSTRGVYASSGSACNSRESLPSHVLLSIGLSKDQARSSVRISFSANNTIDEVDEAARTIVVCANELRKLRT